MFGHICQKIHKILDFLLRYDTMSDKIFKNSLRKGNIMTKETFSTKERIEAIKTHGTSSDEVCYALRRLQKIGAVPFNGIVDGSAKDIYTQAIAQAKKNNQMVSVYLHSGEVKGLFLATPGHPSPDVMDSYWPYFKSNAQENRWDKPIEEQKKNEPYDRFSVYEYAKKLYEKWDAVSIEEQYAAERLEKMGVKPYNGNGATDVADVFWGAMKQAKADKNRVGVMLNSGVIKGLFVVEPQDMADDRGYAISAFQQYVKNQQNLRYDKPIAIQQMEETQVKNANIKTFS